MMKRKRATPHAAPALTVAPGPAAHDPADVARRVGVRLRAMRSARQMSLDALATAAGLSRGALAEIEREERSPSLGTLWRIAVGMGVPFAELLRGDPQGASVLRRGEMQVLRSESGAFESLPLTPAGAPPSLEVYQLTVKAGSVHEAEPHATGTHEVIIVLSGVLRLRVGVGAHDLAAGDSIAFRADVGHAYENPGAVDATCHDVILYPR